MQCELSRNTDSAGKWVVYRIMLQLGGGGVLTCVAAVGEANVLCSRCKCTLRLR